jgi:diguanylate cyclase (GGDEF)-like protein
MAAPPLTPMIRWSARGGSFGLNPDQGARMPELAVSPTSDRTLRHDAAWAAPAPAEPVTRVPRLLVSAVATYFIVYLAWRLSAVGAASTRAVVGDAFMVLPGFPTVAFFWSASRRCSDRRTASAWRWLTASIVFLTAAFGIDLAYQAATGAVPFPSAADACYLSFNALFLVGLVRLPQRRQTRAGKVRVGVDVATIVVAGASVIWFFVLGATVTAGGQSLLNGTIASAYPIGDLVQIFGITFALTRVASRSTQRALQLLAVATLIAIVGDLTHGWTILHAHYSLNLAVDVTFMGGWAFFVLAGPAQRSAMADEGASNAASGVAAVGWVGRAGWFPYLAPAVVFALLIYSQFGGSRFDRISLAIGAAVISLLVSVRQFLSRRDLLSAQGELSYRALHDALTGLPNRTLVLDRAKQLLARAERSLAPAAALYIDVDGFKHINDTFGHATGDEVLRTIATRLSGVVRKADTVGRLGGDEFVVLLDSLSGDAGAERTAERVLEALCAPIESGRTGERPLQISASVGIAVASDVTAEDLLCSADLALYEAKNTGKNRYVAFKPSMQTIAQDRLLLEMDLGAAIADDQLFLLYQPTFDLHSETVTGVEALLRWRHPDRGIVPPAEFIPSAERTGAIVPIGRWVLDEACRQAAEWHRRGHAITMAVNVSARQLDRDEFVDDVRDALTASTLDPGALMLEVTETTLMQDPDQTARRLTLLKELGVRVAIDDFGTGYSSLAYLRQFPVDTLKIDRSFIQTIAESRESAALIQTLVQLGKTLGLETFGEGIEHEAQLRALQDVDCDCGQGFLLARPLEVAAVERYFGSVGLVG